MRIRFSVNKNHVGINQNGARYFCASHGMWLLSRDSHDKLMNKTGEIVIKIHRQTGGDMTELKSFRVDPRGRFRFFHWARTPFAQADNNTLIIAFRRNR
jgi:hypothetical protein